jgi:hypothetical protein
MGRAEKEVRSRLWRDLIRGKCGKVERVKEGNEGEK